MAYTNFDDIYAAVRGGGRRCIAVAAAEDSDVLGSVARVAQDGIADSLLVGNGDKIRAVADEAGISLEGMEIVEADGLDASAARAVALVREGRADLLMKGHIPTPRFMRAVFDRELGLRNGRVLSHNAVVQVPSWPKLLVVADGGINIDQEIATKKDIVASAIDFCHAYGIACPKVAMLTLVETVNERLPETTVAAQVEGAWRNGHFSESIVEGPIALDVALSAHAAAKKGLPSKIAGDVDVLVGASITHANHLVKALICLAGARVGGVVLGARVPIILLSRSDSMQTKTDSIVAAIAAS